MKRSAVLVPVVVAVLAGAAWGLMAASSKPGRWSRFPNQFEVQARKAKEKEEWEKEHGIKSPKPVANRRTLKQEKPATEDAELTTVKAVALEPVYNFGAMDAFSRQRHTFVIRNEGTDTLLLKAGETSCKCTACDVLTPEVPPGGQGLVEMEWKSVGRQESYRHSARVYTNDPTQAFIRLVVEGAVRTHLGAEPPDLNLPRVNPLEPASASTTIYSQSWKSFALTDFVSSLEGMTWEVTPASENDLKPMEGVSGHNLKVILPADLPSGEFRHTLQFMVRHEDENSEPIQYEIAVEGKVLRRLAIQGEAIDSLGIIHLPPVNPKTGMKKRLLMKVNDSDLELPVEKITCSPGYVTVNVSPYKPEGKQVGLYYLDLAIPKDIPPAAFQGEAMGRIQIDFDHPRVEDLDLKLEFVVSPPE